MFFFFESEKPLGKPNPNHKTAYDDIFDQINKIGWEVSGNNPGEIGNTANTLPKLPNRVFVCTRGVTIEHYYHGNEHGPAHAHVNGEGPTVKIGPKGYPLEGQPNLSRTQKAVVQGNIGLIRRELNRIGKWLRWAEKQTKEVPDIPDL